MPSASLLTLIDDIASVLDDVAIMTKVATKKTAGVLGDDLALNAEQVSGVRAERELPVVWAVAKGSALNKVILVPSALLISFFAPVAVTPLLMLGGAFLCYEGVEKLLHKFMQAPEEDAAHHAAHVRVLTDPSVDPTVIEKQKIKGAIRTDFILSAEIIVIALGTVATAPFSQQIAVLTAIGLIMTVGVYGLVAGIVKIDDLGVLLSQKKESVSRAIGAGLLRVAPYLMKFLSLAGTAAMFLVGGGILMHGIPGAESMLHGVEGAAHAVPGVGGVLGGLVPMLANALVGIAAGALALMGVKAVSHVVGRKRGSAVGSK